MNEEDLNNILLRVVKVLDHGLIWQETQIKVREVLLQTKDQENLFEKLQQSFKRYPLLLGFCYKLGVGTVKDEKKAFEHWMKDVTSYGHYLVGRSYFYG